MVTKNKRHHLHRRSVGGCADPRELSKGMGSNDKSLVSDWGWAQTMPRMKHAGRHAVSMLRAVGGRAQILQARNEDEYGEYAVRLLSRPRKWKQVQGDIVRSFGLGLGEEPIAGKTAGATSPLWTPERWVRDVEKALIGAWHWHEYALHDDPFLARGGKAVWGERAGEGVEQDHQGSRTDSEVAWCRGANKHKSMGGGPWKCQRHYAHIVVASTPNTPVPRATSSSPWFDHAAKSAILPPSSPPSPDPAPAHPTTTSTATATKSERKPTFPKSGSDLGSGADAIRVRDSSKPEKRKKNPDTANRAPVVLAAGAGDSFGTGGSGRRSRVVPRFGSGASETAAPPTQPRSTPAPQMGPSSTNSIEVQGGEKMQGGWWPYN